MHPSECSRLESEEWGLILHLFCKFTDINTVSSCPLPQVIFARDLTNLREFLNNAVSSPFRDFPQASNEEQHCQFICTKGMVNHGQLHPCPRPQVQLCKYLKKDLQLFTATHVDPGSRLSPVLLTLEWLSCRESYYSVTLSFYIGFHSNIM